MQQFVHNSWYFGGLVHNNSRIFRWRRHTKKVKPSEYNKTNNKLLYTGGIPRGSLYYTATCALHSNVPKRVELDLFIVKLAPYVFQQSDVGLVIALMLTSFLLFFYLLKRLVFVRQVNIPFGVLVTIACPLSLFIIFLCYN